LAFIIRIKQDPFPVPGMQPRTVQAVALLVNRLSYRG